MQFAQECVDLMEKGFLSIDPRNWISRLTIKLVDSHEFCQVIWHVANCGGWTEDFDFDTWFGDLFYFSENDMHWSLTQEFRSKLLLVTTYILHRACSGWCVTEIDSNGYLLLQREFKSSLEAQSAIDVLDNLVIIARHSERVGSTPEKQIMTILVPTHISQCREVGLI